MYFYKEQPGILLDEDIIVETGTVAPCQLMVWNDEINTFEWVIETLIDICEHTPEQAEQCALLIHTKGNCGVKNGFYESLKPMCNAITERGIRATIEGC